jgi:hypothetical protein
VPQAAGAANGYGDLVTGPGLLAIYPARTEMQLRRSGTNIAKWGFHVLSHQRFQDDARFFRGSNGSGGTFAMREVVKPTSAALHDI